MATDPEEHVERIGARELYAAVIEAAHAAIFIVDPSGRLVTVNAIARDLFGIGPEDHPPLRELLLRGHIRTIDGVPVEHGHGPTTRAIHGETVRGEYAFYHARTGADMTFRVIATPVRGPDRAITGAIVTMHDVSGILRTEREKEEFLSLVTHELKTPLTPLKTVAQLLRMRIRRARSGERPLDMDGLDRNLATIERQVDRMDRLVTDLLEVSRIGRGKFELRPAPFDLAPLVRDVVGRWKDAVAEDGRHTLEIDVPSSAVITADRQRVEQVLMNLVGNAIKYSPHGGSVSVRLEDGGEKARVTVTDKGIGIPPDEIVTLGRAPFERGKRAEGYAGVGIGLYLSRLIAEGHGGRISLASEGDDRGTSVMLELPKVPPTG